LTLPLTKFFFFNLLLKDLDLILLYPHLMFFILHLQNESGKEYTGDGSVDFHGKPVLKQNTGNWRACPFILGNPLFLTLLQSNISMNSFYV